MMMLALSLLAGIVLGMRFKVLVLVPAIACVLAIALGIGTARAHGFGPPALMAAGAVASLQIGYFTGVAIRLAASRTRTLRSASFGSFLTRRPAS